MLKGLLLHSINPAGHLLHHPNGLCQQGMIWMLPAGMLQQALYKSVVRFSSKLKRIKLYWDFIRCLRVWLLDACWGSYWQYLKNLNLLCFVKAQWPLVQCSVDTKKSAYPLHTFIKWNLELQFIEYNFSVISLYCTAEWRLTLSNNSYWGKRWTGLIRRAFKSSLSWCSLARACKDILTIRMCPSASNIVHFHFPYYIMHLQQYA